jgi:DNA-binding MarR family transcriptional regulator
VTLNNDQTPTPDPTSDPTQPARDTAPPDSGRDTLIAELVEEMTAWSPRERINVFRSWLKGSLSLIHLHVLTVLEADGPLPMSHLAETLDVSVASTTGIIGRMEERGLVERSHGEADRRVVLVRPTEAGIAIFRDMTEHRRQSLTHLFGRLTDAELSALLIGLRAMRAARLALHVEKAKEGLVAVTLAPAGTDDAAIVAENAATPKITRGKG